MVQWCRYYRIGSVVSQIVHEFSLGIQGEHPYVLLFIGELGGEFGCYHLVLDIGILPSSYLHLTVETHKVTYGVRHSS